MIIHIENGNWHPLKNFKPGEIAVFSSSVYIVTDNPMPDLPGAEFITLADLSDGTVTTAPADAFYKKAHLDEIEPGNSKSCEIQYSSPGILCAYADCPDKYYMHALIPTTLKEHVTVNLQTGHLDYILNGPTVIYPKAEIAVRT